MNFHIVINDLKSHLKLFLSFLSTSFKIFDVDMNLFMILYLYDVGNEEGYGLGLKFS